MNQNEPETSTGTVEDPRSELDAIIEKIKSEEHSEVKARREVLLKIKEKRIHSIELLKKKHIQSISELYNFEKEEANAIFRRDLDEFVDALCAEARNEHLKAQAAKNQPQPNRPVTGSGRVSRRISEASENGNGHHGNGHGSNGHANNGNVSSLNGNKRKLYATSLGFEKAIPESDIRGDFIEIVSDLEDRAKRFADFNSKTPQVDVTIYRAGVPLPSSTSSPTSSSQDGMKTKYLGLDLSGNRMGDGVQIGSIFFPIGCLVRVHSKFSQEELHGVLFSISESELVCRCGSGVKFRVRIDHIACGRLSISQSEECYEAIQVMKDVAQTLTADSHSRSGLGPTLGAPKSALGAM